MPRPAASPGERLVCVVHNAHVAYYLAQRSKVAATATGAISELIGNGHADLAFDLHCESLRKSAAGQQRRWPIGSLNG